MAEIRVHRETPSIAVVTIDNPARRNALTLAMWRALGEACVALSGDREVRAVILTGAGDHFSAGADISEFAAVRTGLDAATAYEAAGEACQDALMTLPKPTIAAIGGYCIGGGCGLVTCCDFRVADSSARFAVPAAKLGIVYGLRECQRLFALVGVAQAKRILYGGEQLDAAEAARIGLVDELVETDSRSAAQDMAERLANNAPLSIAGSKLALNALALGQAEDRAEEIDGMVKSAVTSEDYEEGKRAFMEKRRPKFTGC